MAEHPLMLRWYMPRPSSSNQQREAPQPSDLQLAGVATSYELGWGLGSPWTARPKLVDDWPASNWHPYSIPHFAQEYWYRERCWDVRATREQFIPRLARRLFDADMPAEAIQYYTTLSDLCLPSEAQRGLQVPKEATEEVLGPIDAFVKARATHGTSRNRDTLARMREAIDGFRKTRVAEDKKK